MDLNFFEANARILFLLLSLELNFDRNFKHSIRAFVESSAGINLKINNYL